MSYRKKDPSCNHHPPPPNKYTPLILLFCLKIYQYHCILLGESCNSEGVTFNKLWWLCHEINLIIVSLTNYEIPLLLLMVMGDQDMDWVAICGKGQHYFWPLGHCLEEQASRRFGQKPDLGWGWGGGTKLPWYFQLYLLCPFPHLSWNSPLRWLGLSTNLNFIPPKHKWSLSMIFIIAVITEEV